MTMGLDPSQQQHFGPSINFDYQAHAQPPAFSKPRSFSSPPQSMPAAFGPGSALFNVHGGQPSLPPTMLHGKPIHGRDSTGSASSMTSYGSIPLGSSSSSLDPSSASHGMQHDLLNPNQDMLAMKRMQTSTAAFGEPSYPPSASPINNPFTTPTSSSYEAMGYTAAPTRSHPFPIGRDDPSRRFSQTLPSTENRRVFADALDASHGMLAMSQYTPRNIYGGHNDRSTINSYGFPATHSTSSSISTTGNISSYCGDLVSDYSTAGSDIELRTLPRLLGPQIPLAPQSMMGQFSSKVSPSTQKKHKCKVCDKGFTRPSSLQTHMYSHTGEKPFACDLERCGRHFSVVSNLRRHRKVHRDDTRLEAGS